MVHCSGGLPSNVQQTIPSRCPLHSSRGTCVCRVSVGGELLVRVRVERSRNVLLECIVGWWVVGWEGDLMYVAPLFSMTDAPARVCVRV